MTMGKSATGLQSEINVTPMIDVLLVLLIIFMVIVPVMSKGESALAPRPATHEASDTSGAVVLEIAKGASGELSFRINQQTVSRMDLPGRLAEIYANRSSRVLFVKGDDKLSFTQVADAIDIGHAAGVDRVALMTPKTQVGL